MPDLMQRYYAANPWMRKYEGKTLPELAELMHLDESETIFAYYLIRATHLGR